MRERDQFIIAAFIVCLWFMVPVSLVVIYAQRPERSEHRVTLKVPEPVGRIATVRRTELRQFDRAIDLPRFPAPAITHPGHVWRWHRNFGWVGVPVPFAPAELVLPNTYALPAQVVTYTTTGAAPVTITCPHCGRQITVELNQ